MQPTKTLAKYVAEARFDQFPEEVITQAKYCLLDALGCSLGGAQTSLGQKYIASAEAFGGNPESTVIGGGARISCVYAAYVNSLLNVALDYDDTYLYALSHPGGPVIHAALAAADMVHASGRELLSAIITGYEVSIRVGRALRSMTLEGGIRRVLFSSAFTVFGAAASAGKLLGLDEAGLISAFGLAGNQAPGTPRGHWHGGTPAKLGEAKFAYQIHTLRGIFSAWQALHGIEGPAAILDGDIFWTSGGAEACNFAELTEGLGHRYRITEIGFKPEPSCRLIHPSTEAIRKALRDATVKPSDIEKITLHQAVLLPPTYRWETMVEAQFSPPCAVALSLAGGEPLPAWYTEQRFLDPAIHELASRVRFVEDDRAADLWLKYGILSCRAEVSTRDGKILHGSTDYPRGEPQNPMTREELERKFMVNAGLVMDDRRAGMIRDRVLDIEAMRNISELADHLHSAVKELTC
jgi:2-methylcitrate dehydratase PrpD